MNPDKQLLILATTTGYQIQAFVEAAHKLGLGVVFGTDRCHVLEDPWRDGALPLRFEDSVRSAEQIVEFARRNRVDAVVALGDRPTVTAARACEALGLAHHPPEAVEACRDKHRSREQLRAGGVNVPAFTRHLVSDDPHRLVAQGLPTVGFPFVLKPLALCGSRGVIRADSPGEFVAAFQRISNLLRSPDVQVLREDQSQFIQVEAYVEGAEVAVEALVARGQLKVLAIFDKPDPLVGPYFEETLYVTPSCLRPEAQAAIVRTLAEAVRVLGLFHGPVHAEFRLSRDEPWKVEGSRRAPEPAPGAGPRVWALEIAARPIGGLCSRALRFSSPILGADMSLEELLIHLALGVDVRDVRRESQASGVMMIPIPQAGVYQDVEGVEEALRTPGVEDVVVTAKPAQRLVALPEGSGYLGFIFARGASPQLVENALRQAHEKLRFGINPVLPVI